VLSTWQL